MILYGRITDKKSKIFIEKYRISLSWKYNDLETVDTYMHDGWGYMLYNNIRNNIYKSIILNL